MLHPVSRGVRSGGERSLLERPRSERSLGGDAGHGEQKNPRPRGAAEGSRVTTAQSYADVADTQPQDFEGDNVDDLPEWAGRQLLADALRTCGLPWVPGAWWRRPADRWMSPADTTQAICLEGLVVAEARRRLPWGTTGKVLGREWRDAAWRCIVAGLALLDADARERLACGDEHGGEHEREQLATSTAPKVPTRSDHGRDPRHATPARQPAAAAPVTFTIRRRGEVSHAP
jgi:hypothetical protein